MRVMRKRCNGLTISYNKGLCRGTALCYNYCLSIILQPV